jgi:hypothetical protein
VKNLFAELPYFSGRMFMRSTTLAALALSTTLPATAQYPGQVKQQDQQNQVMRAIAVLEWTGDENHPKNSRLVPVVLYDGQQLQDAGIYMARPAPMALSSEVEYELKNNGKTTGLFVVGTAGQEQGSWVGFGSWRPLPRPKPPAPVAKIDSKDAWGNDNDEKPVLHRKQHDGKETSKGGDPGSNAPADPDRPTLHKKTSDDDSAGNGTSAPDPDRPTLKKKADKPEKPSSPQADLGHVESVKTVTDPDRPKLLRGKPADQGGSVLPNLNGMPPDLLQAVAISDAKNRPEHVWSYSWANPADEGNMKTEMEDIARQTLELSHVEPAASSEAQKVKATNAHTTSTHTTSAAHKKTTPPLAPVPLLDEHFRVFELAYGSGATLVLSARTDGEGAQMKFVTLICQPNIYGKATVLYKSVTDAAHLDETPRMRLVDAVDVMADNRGELLFELRGATQRQFALYRVLRGQVTRLFATGLASIVPEMADSAADPHS